MTELDYVPFTQGFTSVLGYFPKVRFAPAKVEELSRAYFEVLKAHPLADVLQAGKRCLAQPKRRAFPAVGEWLAELPATPRTAPADVRHMTVTEIQAHEEAARRRYEDEPCLCAECERAGVMHRPIRFVPTLVNLFDDTSEYEQAFNPRTGKLEIVGHWAHGIELRNYYAARDHFASLKVPRDLARAVALITGEREPGEEG